MVSGQKIKRTQVCQVLARFSGGPLPMCPEDGTAERERERERARVQVPLPSRIESSTVTCKCAAVSLGPSFC